MWGLEKGLGLEVGRQYLMMPGRQRCRQDGVRFCKRPAGRQAGRCRQV